MKIGIMVFLCHDVNDIFMEVAKLCRYAQREGLATCMFTVFLISWFASRMIYFPLWCIRSAWSEPLTVRFECQVAHLQCFSLRSDSAKAGREGANTTV